MSTAAAVRAAWKEKVFDDASVLAVTTKIYDEELPKDFTGNRTANHQLERLRYQQEYNFIEYLVTKYDSGGVIGATRYLYRVNVILNRETTPDGGNVNVTKDLMNTIQGLMVSALGVTWNSTVDRYLPLSGQPTENFYSIKGKRLFRSRREFVGEKII
jgi:hypothetical protein